MGINMATMQDSPCRVPRILVHRLKYNLEVVETTTKNGLGIWSLMTTAGGLALRKVLAKSITVVVGRFVLRGACDPYGLDIENVKLVSGLSASFSRMNLWNIRLDSLVNFRP
jgi:hypothetical protein